MPPSPQPPAFQPVILGGGIGAYSLARAYHEQYGVRTVVLSTAATGPVHNSAIIEHIIDPAAEQADSAVRLLRSIAARYPGQRRLLTASADWLVRLLIANRDQLSDLYELPYPTLAAFDSATDKASFGQLCDKLGIETPRTVEYDVQSGGAPTVPFDFPIIAKAASTSDYHTAAFPGRKKVFRVESQADLDALMQTIRASGYAGTFLFQDLIPGDDSGMRILTCYCDKHHAVRFASFGQVLLEEHTPGALGQPAAIFTDANTSIVRQATQLLDEIGWVGYANFDLKLDPRTGRLVFFELNPRLGASNYYITAAGFNVTLPYVREWVADTDPLDGVPMTELTNRHLYTFLPRRLVMRYVTDPQLRTDVAALMRSATNPWWYRADHGPRRLAYVVANQLNQYRKFAKYYPAPRRAAR